MFFPSLNLSYLAKVKLFLCQFSLYILFAISNI